MDRVLAKWERNPVRKKPERASYMRSTNSRRRQAPSVSPTRARNKKRSVSPKVRNSRRAFGANTCFGKKPTGSMLRAKRREAKRASRNPARQPRGGVSTVILNPLMDDVVISGSGVSAVGKRAQPAHPKQRASAGPAYDAHGRRVVKRSWM